ncbi:erythromycin esterase family protein [Dictyobacter aurantiacus]|uniref:Erythromycin esterase n=1 Tax=Dictyobacter aurantiacus TaxID=1936993 RepID=A0A401ZKC9_9CHLR|nr:erythromycin esterase family protein [Dictyobacter aurantiacus]GCE07327.1 erythromycin esterase [Dictyobacter aurantiacus]
MTHAIPTYATLDDWIARETCAFSLDDPQSFATAIDQMMASPGEQVELLGLGEAFHGGAGFLTLRNRLFQYLVQAHGYSSIALESSFPQGCLVNEYISGRGPASYEEVQQRGFSHNFGKLEENQELVEWMRQYNADPAHAVKLRFYGFDSPTDNIDGADSPRQVLRVALDYLSSIDKASGQRYRSRIEPLLGQDAAWQNPYALIDPAQSIGLSPEAAALRIETEDLISELLIRRPELGARSGPDRYREALQFTSEARQLLNYHAELARTSDERIARLLGIRDAMMADNLAYIVAQERERGKVLAFAQNAHLGRGKARMQFGADLYEWWPAGAQLNAMFGPRYVVIGSAVGVSEATGIGQPETGTLESLLTAAPGPARLIPTHRGQGLPASEIAALPTRSGSTKHPGYFTLTSDSLAEFDWLAVLDATTYSRGGPPLLERDS